MKRFFKTFLPLLLIVAMLTASMPAFAASSVTSKAIETAHASAVLYNGKYHKPVVTVYDASGNKVSSKYYTVEVRNSAGTKKMSGNKAKKAGKYNVKVTGKAPYTGKAYCWFYILKKNPFKISVKKTVKRGRTYTIKATGAKGASVSWSYPTSVFSKSGNKLTVKSGAKKGTYTIRATAAGKYPYGKTTKSVKVKVR